MRCAKCGSVKNLETHHIAPKRFFGIEADDWPTIVFCSSCHQELENGQFVDSSIDADQFIDRMFGIGIVPEPIPCVVVES